MQKKKVEVLVKVCGRISLKEKKTLVKFAKTNKVSLSQAIRTLIQAL